MITFFIVLTEIVAEKESRQRLGMKMMGLSDAPYWLTWWLYGVTFVTLSTLVLLASGYAFQFDIFWNSNPLCMFILFFAFGMAVTTLSMFVSSFIQKASTAQTGIISPFKVLTSLSWICAYFGGIRFASDSISAICDIPLV
jgi:hypothetical protein